MKPDFRKSMIWLHTYSGLVLGWLLFAIFITGTLSYFTPEISQWMKPELQQTGYNDNNYIKIINQSLTRLNTSNDKAERWRIYLPNSRTNHWKVEWRTGRKRTTENLSIINNESFEIRDSRGGEFFRSFHYTLQLRSYGGRYIAGIAAMFMLVAIFTGIFTHRRFFRDFFTLRKAKLTKLLSDSHALMGIVTLPFCIMICSSALMIYVTMYIPFGAEHYYDGGERELNKHIIPSIPKLKKDSPEAEPLTDFSIIQQQINILWSGVNKIDYITYEQPHRVNGRVIVNKVKDHSLSNQAERLVFSSVTGEILQGYPKQSSPAKVRRIFYGLHEAKFADTVLRWTLFILGLLASALIASGLIIWLNKRLEKVKKRHIGHSIVECLNVAGITGLLLAILAFFHASRLLPLDIINRASVEVSVFLWTWLASLLHSILRPVNKAWFEQLYASALLCFLLPIVDFYQNQQWLISAIEQVNSTYIMFTITTFIFSLLFAKTALWLKRRQRIIQGHQ